MAPAGTSESVTLRLMWRAIRRTLTRGPVIVPLAGPPRSFALLAAPEALPGFERLTSGNGWRNEVNIARGSIAFARFRPVQKAAQIRGPVLLQAGERDGMVPPRAIETVTTRASHAELEKVCAQGAIESLAALWAYELQTARLSGPKREGLKNRYHVEETAFFALHEQLDVHHAKDMLDALARRCGDDLALIDRACDAAIRSVKAQWHFLDGVEARRTGAAA